MSTLIVNGHGSHFKVTSKGTKTPKVLLITNTGTKRLQLTKSTDVKFAA